MIRFGSTSITVTLTSVPSSWKAWVMCFLRPYTAVAIAVGAFISMFTPAGRSSRCSESTVRGVAAGCL